MIEASAEACHELVTDTGDNLRFLCFHAPYRDYAEYCDLRQRLGGHSSDASSGLHIKLVGICIISLVNWFVVRGIYG